MLDGKKRDVMPFCLNLKKDLAVRWNLGGGGKRSRRRNLISRFRQKGEKSG